MRLPFIAAAVLNACNLLLAFFVLPESRTPTREKIDLAALNPLRPLRWVFSMKRLLPIIFVFFIFSATGEAYGVCWALWGSDTFQWNGLWIGLSLGAFGVCQTLAQAFLPGPAVKLLGERAAILTGVAGAGVALLVMAFATQGWMIFAIMPVFALGGIGVPALQSLATRQVDATGRASSRACSPRRSASPRSSRRSASRASISSSETQWPGAIWLSVVAVYAAACRWSSACTSAGRQRPRSHIDDFDPGAFPVHGLCMGCA